jgi:hypothetical protein
MAPASGTSKHRAGDLRASVDQTDAPKADGAAHGRQNHSDASAPFCPAGNLLVVASSGGIWLVPAAPLDEIQRYLIRQKSHGALIASSM